MSRIYTISFAEVAVTAAQDMFEILVPADAVMRLHSIVITQSSDAKNSESEQLPFSIKRVTGAPTSGSGGSTPTPRPISQGDAAAGITAEANNTTRLTGGTSVDLWREDINVMSGWYYIPTPEMRIDFSPSTRCIIGLEEAPEDSLTMSGTVVVEEIGG